MIICLLLVVVQLGIWMVECFFILSGVWSVVYYVELCGVFDLMLLGKVIVVGLQQVDIFSLCFEEEEGEVWQWLVVDCIFVELLIIDLCMVLDLYCVVMEWMQVDLVQDLCVDGGNLLVCYQLLCVGDDCWYWYQ